MYEILYDLVSHVWNYEQFSSNTEQQLFVSGAIVLSIFVLLLIIDSVFQFLGRVANRL